MTDADVSALLGEQTGFLTAAEVAAAQTLHMADKTTDALPTDVARCAGSWYDGELREGCDDCQRRTSGHPTGPLTVWFSPPLIIVFECELRIAP